MDWPVVGRFSNEPSADTVDGKPKSIVAPLRTIRNHNFCWGIEFPGVSLVVQNGFRPSTVARSVYRTSLLVLSPEMTIFARFFAGSYDVDATNSATRFGTFRGSCKGSMDCIGYWHAFHARIPFRHIMGPDPSTQGRDCDQGGSLDARRNHHVPGPSDCPQKKGNPTGVPTPKRRGAAISGAV